MKRTCSRLHEIFLPAVTIVYEVHGTIAVLYTQLTMSDHGNSVLLGRSLFVICGAPAIACSEHGMPESIASQV